MLMDAGADVNIQNTLLFLAFAGFVYDNDSQGEKTLSNIFIATKISHFLFWLQVVPR